MSSVWCLSAWGRFHRTDRIRPARPGGAGRCHTAAGAASIASLSSPPPPPFAPGSRCHRPGATRRAPQGGGVWLPYTGPSTAQCWGASGLGLLGGEHDMHYTAGGRLLDVSSTDSRVAAHAGPTLGWTLQWKGGVTAHAAGTSAPLSGCAIIASTPPAECLVPRAALHKGLARGHIDLLASAHAGLA